MENLLFTLLPIIISLIALYITINKFKTDKLAQIHEKIFDELLLNYLPVAFNEFLLDTSSNKVQETFTENISKLTKAIGFYQFFNVYVYNDLREIIVHIDENFVFYCNDKNSMYISKISADIRKLYTVVYNLSLFRILYYDFKYRFRKNK